MKSIFKQDVFEYPSLQEDICCEYCIVGAGLAGISLAYLLKDYDVVLVDQQGFMQASSSMNTGKLTAQHGACYHRIIQKYGIDVAKQYYLDNEKALDLVKQWHAQFPFTLTMCDTMLYAYKNTKELKKEYLAYQQLHIPSKLSKHYLYMLNQYQFHPIEVAKQLLTHNTRLRCYQNTQITNYTTTTPILLNANTHKIQAHTVIFTNHSPTLFSEFLLFIRYKAYTSYILMKPYPFKKPFNILSIDNDKTSLRTIEHNQQKYVLICKEDHRFGIPNHTAYQTIDNQTQRIATTIHQQWQNHDYITHDLLPFIDEIHPNIFLTFGYNLWGNSWSIASGILLYDTIINKNNKLYPYRINRLKDYLTIPFLTTNLETLYLYLKYYLLYFYKKTNGSTIQFQNKTFGYYENKDYKYIIDIHCPHLGCILQYNSNTQTWDCPCHASSFSQEGTRIAGPTSKSLQKIQIITTNKISGM